MSNLRPFRLASLRRASALAGFMLIVFLVRVGITVACEPHEFAELFGGETELTQAVAVGDPGDDGDLSDPASDHCRQCSCHHGVTLISPPMALAVVKAMAVDVIEYIPRTDVPPERDLRPPIV
jgi:hypothetical protein